MAWLVLVVSGLLEAVWATALGKSDGFSRPLPTLVFAVASLVSFIGLAHATRSLPVGTAYAVWVGIGASLTAATPCGPVKSQQALFASSCSWASSPA